MVKRGIGSVVIVLGILCLVGAVLLTVFNIRTDTAAFEANSDILEKLRAAEPDEYVEQPTTSDVEIIPESIIPQQTVDVPVEAKVEVDGNDYIGTIAFPVFGLELPVMDECTNDSIAVAPGRYAGSVEEGGFVIGGHNYVSHFGRLNRLKPGNEIIFTDVNDNAILYEVFGAEVIDGTAIDLLVTDEWDLSLFTCTFSGSQRYVVRCMKAEPEK